MGLDYVPDYVVNDLWLCVPETLSNALTNIEKKIKSLRDKQESHSDLIVKKLMDAILEEGEYTYFGDNNVSIYHVDLMLDTSCEDILLILPFLLASYVFNYSSNKLMKNARVANTNTPNVSGSFSGFDQIFNHAPIYEGNISNYKKNVWSLTRRFTLKQEKVRSSLYEDMLANLDIKSQAGYLYMIFVFVRFIQLCSKYQEVNLTLSLYTFQYYTYALDTIEHYSYQDENKNYSFGNCDFPEDIILSYLFSGSIHPGMDITREIDFNRAAILDFAAKFIEKFPIKLIDYIRHDSHNLGGFDKES